MPRNLPASAPRWESPNPTATVWRLPLRTITPMFGGGATPREIGDPPIRAASVRGHLRFWWRATSGVQFADAEELYEKETALWGDAGNPGAVMIRVQMISFTEPVRCGRYETNREGRFRPVPKFNDHWPPYALQPFQGKARAAVVEEEPSYALLNATFEVTIAMKAEHRTQVEQAVAAWVHFGGIGARTRRGCGSLSGRQLPTLYPVVGGSPLLTTLPVRYFIGEPKKNPLVAWEQAVSLYRDFRQGVGFARNKGQEPNRPGRSRWPEADSIRRITKQAAYGHEPTAHPERAFPRADLGLPIIFHFQGQSKGDPEETTLEGSKEKLTRFASPVITKALALPNGDFAPMIALLESPPVWACGDLTLKRGREKETTVRRGDIELTGRPMNELKQNNIRDALVAWVQRNGYEEVKL